MHKKQQHVNSRLRSYRFKINLPIMTCGGDTSVRIRRKRTKIATMTPVRLIRSMSVIFTAFAERTRNITDILKKGIN